MKVFHVSCNAPKTVFHEKLWRTSFTVYLYLKRAQSGYKHLIFLVVFQCRHQFCYPYNGFISIFLCVIVLQTVSPTECINTWIYHVDSPTKPILAALTPSSPNSPNSWCCSTVGLSIQWSRSLYHKSYFS